LIVLGEAQRNKFNGEPALSFVPDALAPEWLLSYDSTCWFVIDIEVTGSICSFTVATSIA
jgi:hypothetical protein